MAARPRSRLPRRHRLRRRPRCLERAGAAARHRRRRPATRARAPRLRLRAAPRRSDPGGLASARVARAGRPARRPHRGRGGVHAPGGVLGPGRRRRRGALRRRRGAGRRPRARPPDGTRRRFARRVGAQGVPQGHGPDGRQPVRHPGRGRCLGSRPRARTRDDPDGVGREDQAGPRRHRRLVRLHVPHRSGDHARARARRVRGRRPRLAQGRIEVAIGGKRYPIAGRVAMDQFLVDVGDDDVRTGDTVTLFGTGEHDEMTVLDWGRSLGTIGEEIVCRIGTRVPRFYEGHDIEGRVGEYLRGDQS
ncbi:hypothetical protein JN350_01350 [Curtobacterium sp. 24E2]|nr:hypothetical protein JN350_01350 [Curtobacterium sp. 24E2]